MDRSKFKVPEPKVKTPRAVKPDTLSGISMPKESPSQQVDKPERPALEESESPEAVIATNRRPLISSSESVGFVNHRQSPEYAEYLQNSDAEEPQASETEPEQYESDSDTEENYKISAFKLFKISLIEILRAALINTNNLYKSRKAILISGVSVIVVLLVVVSLVIFNNDGAKSSTSQSQSQNEVSSNSAVASADFIVFGPKTGSTFTATRADYSRDPSTGSITVEAKSSEDGDARRITISEQKVPSNFETDPYGLKNLLVSVGKTYKVATKNSTSYIVEAYSTALTVRGETLLFVRTTEALTTQEWVDLFDSLQPIVTTELGL
jgi:hypothetical protein